MNAARPSATLLTALLLPLTFACSGGEDPDDGGPNFTSVGGSMDGTASATDEVGESGDMDMGTTTAGKDTMGTDTMGTDTTAGTTTDSSDTDTTTTAGTTGGDCMTPSDQAGSSCGQDSGVYGNVAIGEAIAGLPLGVIADVDNGIGNGAEDWYRFDFGVTPQDPRPGAGTATISFALNDGGDYRFELYRDCGAQAYGQGLAADFGTNAPPLEEWTFNDLDPGPNEQLEYMEMVLWPTSVWVRVFRVTNDGSCGQYQLEVTRTP